jgi:shikimate kinase
LLQPTIYLVFIAVFVIMMPCLSLKLENVFMKILLAGPRCSGKSTIGKLLCEKLGIGFFETDSIIEDLYCQKTGEGLKCPDIYRKLGGDSFRQLEQQAVEKAANMDYVIISLGGGTLKNQKSRLLLRQNSIFIAVKADIETLWQRHNQRTNTAIKFDNKQDFETKIQSIIDTVNPLADIIADTSAKTEQQVADEIIEQLWELFHT